jgi:hypothetical protein
MPRLLGACESTCEDFFSTLHMHMKIVGASLLADRMPTILRSQAS